MKDNESLRQRFEVRRRVLANILLGGLFLLTAPIDLVADKSDDLYKGALEQHQKGELEGARKDLEESLRLKPGNEKATALLGLTCFQLGNKFKSQGNAALALAAFQEAVTTDPEEAYWRAALSRAMRDAGDGEDADRECSEAMRLSPLDALLRAGCRPPQTAAEVLAEDKIAAETVRGEIWAPRPIKRKEPPYSEKARQARHQGVTVLYIVVNSQGDVVWLAVVEPLGLGLDQQALKTVSSWKFDPAKLKGVDPVAVRVVVEVQFRLY